MKQTMVKNGWLILLALSLALLLPSAALAAFVSINTDDAVIDPAWSTVTVFLTSPDDPGIDNSVDIKQASVARSADNSFWYFQVILYGQLPLDNLTSLEARISCNGDATFESIEDKVILYYHADPAENDNVIECEGSDYPLCSMGETQGSDFGEEVAVGDGTFSYEWKAELTNPGGVDWSTCDGAESVQFGVASETGTSYETTSSRGFDVPTLVRLQSFSARKNLNLSLALALGVGLLFSSGLLWLRKRR